ncbi:MAG: hypothetical protein HC770_00620 [Pseudanabaena sp. CRU_2_10]|nr:hypothetical protein [Pseudanabaena sp. CRU_2_10]
MVSTRIDGGIDGEFLHEDIQAGKIEGKREGKREGEREDGEGLADDVLFPARLKQTPTIGRR